MGGLVFFSYGLGSGYRFGFRGGGMGVVLGR